MHSLAQSGRYDAAGQILLTSNAEAGNALNTAVNTMMEKKTEQAKETSDGNTRTAHRAVGIMLVLLILSVVAATLLGVFISRSIAIPLKQGVDLMKELSLGHLGKRLKLSRRDEVGELATFMDHFADDLQGIVGTLKKVSEGDLSQTLTPKDAQDELSPAVNGTVESLRGLVSEAQDLSQDLAVAGQLSVRGQADRFQGAYHEIVKGVNHTLDAVIGPLNVAAEYVDRISKGDIPPKITDTYNGDFNEIKNNLNTCIDAINGLMAEMNPVPGDADGRTADPRQCREVHRRFPRDGGRRE